MEDGSSFFISIDFFLFYKLKKGMVVSPELLTLIKKESSFVEAYTKAISLLRRQKYSVFYLRKKLNGKGFDSSVIDQVVTKLTEQGYLDDYSFAVSWIESRLKSKLDSYNSLLAGLIKKGISTSIAKEALEELYNVEIEGDIIKKSIDKYCRQGKTSDKIINALLRKGFNQNRVFKYIKKD